MLAIEEALKLTDLAAVDAQIKCRVELRSKMVGTLYPSVLYGEEQMLYDLKWKLRIRKKKES